MQLGTPLEKCQGGAKAVPKHAQQVDVVEVYMAGKAMGQVVFWVDVNEHFAASSPFSESGNQANFVLKMQDRRWENEQSLTTVTPT